MCKIVLPPFFCPLYFGTINEFLGAHPIICETVCLDHDWRFIVGPVGAPFLWKSIPNECFKRKNQDRVRMPNLDPFNCLRMARMRASEVGEQILTFRIAPYHSQTGVSLPSVFPAALCMGSGLSVPQRAGHLHCCAEKPPVIGGRHWKVAGCWEFSLISTDSPAIVQRHLHPGAFSADLCLLNRRLSSSLPGSDLQMGERLVADRNLSRLGLQCSAAIEPGCQE